MNNCNQNNIYRTDYYLNNSLRNKYPRLCQKNNSLDNDRVGGFLVPFIAGAAISAPFWFIAGNNKQQQQQPVMYTQPVEYYPYYQPYYLPPYTTPR